ncbi:mitochondrial carrier [Xylariaceae sp. FL1651]|nr:mitochondrial carrier [Xylariaceae sp. FL1651]
MSADFWAGYISGAVGILIGNPLDIIKVRLQAQSQSQPTSSEPPLSNRPSISLLPSTSSPATSSFTRYFQAKSSLVAGTAAPVLGYGALNAILFVTYNRSEEALNNILASTSSSASLSSVEYGNGIGSNLWTTWLAGAAGGLATWVISTPTELIKCRAQLGSAPTTFSLTSPAPPSSYHIARTILRTDGIRGLYHGGVVTALRDSIGYGFYFWAYELGGRLMTSLRTSGSDVNNAGSNGTSSVEISKRETDKVLLCGGIAGVVTWASIFPLDVIKTRVQGEVHPFAVSSPARTALLGIVAPKRKGAIQIAKEAYGEGGARVFFRGLTVCSIRAFIVNAVQWAVYEWIIFEIDQGDRDRRK